jgi:hypothetical protein
MRPTIGQRVEIDLFGLSTPAGSLGGATVGSGTIVELAPGTITVRLDSEDAEVTIGPSRLLAWA